VHGGIGPVEAALTHDVAHCFLREDARRARRRRTLLVALTRTPPS
jgi:hypothetical protein